MLELDSRRNKSELSSITFILSFKDAEIFKRDVNGIGGMQSFLRELKTQMFDDENGDTFLYLKRHQIRRIRQYATKYGESGGFQQRFRGVLNSLEELKL